MQRFGTFVCAMGLLGLVPAIGLAEPMPFSHKVEVFREHRPREGDVLAFTIRLEQPFLAEAFEKSNYLRLEAMDRNAYLIYPKETKFHQKHAEFYGRLRGDGKAKLRLSYELVSENADGSRKVDVRHTDVEVLIPVEAGGPRTIYDEWARQQNAYFLSLLQYYPDESFFQYLLLQSKDRFGVEPPALPKPAPDRAMVEADLYDVLSGGLAVHESLQHQILVGNAPPGDLNLHISALGPPRLQSLDYPRLLEEKAKKNIKPKVHDMARLVPEDQYFIHFHSMNAAGELFDLTNDWGHSLLRLFTVKALDNRLQEKLETQLIFRRDPLTKLFADAVIAEVVITGSDPYVLEGTDVTLIFRVKKPEAFEAAAANWLADVKKQRPDLEERQANYKGHKVLLRSTKDRVVSSFVVKHDEFYIYSNSPAAVQKMVETINGKVPPLANALDYRYVTTILPPVDDAKSGYLFASEAFIKRLIGPEAKIAEKRRLQCYNNLVMLNNASLMYRLEHGKSPTKLSDLVEGRYVDLSKVYCPHGGPGSSNYSFDPSGDMCFCSAHNRLKYLTPNAELEVLKVSAAERDEYERYKRRYEQFWQGVFDPVAIRITVAPRVKLEVCVLPFANGSLYNDIRNWVDEKPQAIDTGRLAASSVVSFVAVRGRKQIGDIMRDLPGVTEALAADPTITDLSWLGDRIAVHLCDGGTILEVDWIRMGDLNFPGLGQIPIAQQAMVGALLTATQQPVYVTIDVEDRDKAARLLDQLSAKIILKKGNLLGLPTALDAYRLPDYQKHQIYVLSYRVYALKFRLHVALVGNQLVAATRPEILREVIDAAANPQAHEPVHAHLLLRLNRRGLVRMRDDLQLYWSEKARQACHRNTISIHTLLKLYEVPIEEVPKLADAKYGVRYFCPDHGVYGWDNRREQVECSVHGNRQNSKQNLRLDRRGSFAEFIDNLNEVVASLRFQDDALITTIEISRRQPQDR